MSSRRTSLISLLLSTTSLWAIPAFAQSEAPAAEAAPAEAPAPAPEAAPAPAASAAAATPAPAAAEPAPAEAPAAEATPAPDAKPKPPPYSLPFQLRPVAAASVIRSDTAIAFYKAPNTDKSGSTVASMLLASYKLSDNFAPMLRLGVASNSPPDLPAIPATATTPAVPAPKSGFNFLNPVLGGTFALKPAKDLRLALFLGVTVPIGSGGGDKPDPGNALANAAGIAARSAMDNAMFAVNDLTIFPGVDFAYVAGGFTAQVEATVFQLTRVRGKNNPKTPDSSRTNFTTGLHLGYFIVPEFSVGAELRHQRWLSTPKAIEADKTDTLRDTTTVALGVRGHFKLGEKTWLRPALAFAMPIDEPLTKSKYKTLQIDIPFAF